MNNTLDFDLHFPAQTPEQKLRRLQIMADRYLAMASKDPKYYHLWKFTELTIAEGEALLAKEKYETRRTKRN